MKAKSISVGALAAGVVYFVLAIFFMPEIFSMMLAPPRPAPEITGVTLSDDVISLGREFYVRVSAANRGDPADLQLVSVAFPNATGTNIIAVRDHNFKQSPLFIGPGDSIAYGYTGVQNAVASYPAIEGISRPWEPGEAFSIDLSVRPENEGRFVVFVKSVALPHNGNQAHYPDGGLTDQQGEYVAAYEVMVTKG